jgi:cation transport ATPase
MVTSATARDSTLAGIVRMVQSAQQERSPATRLVARYALFFVLSRSSQQAAVGW